MSVAKRGKLVTVFAVRGAGAQQLLAGQRPALDRLTDYLAINP